VQDKQFRQVQDKRHRRGNPSFQFQVDRVREGETQALQAQASGPTKSSIDLETE
jgi:hypothetical protein